MIIMEDLPFSDIAAFWIAFAVIFASVASIFYVIKWWISAIFASWDQEKVKEALHTVRYAIVWLVIVFFAVIIVKLVWSIFWINLTQYLNVDDVTKMFNLIIKRLNWDFSESSSGSDEDALDF